MYSVDLSSDIFRAGRESLFLVILVAAVRGLESRKTSVPAIPVRPVLIVLICCLILEIIQIAALASGRYFGIPASYYIMGTGTIANDNSLRFNMGSLRPSATFSEPSYYGLVLLTLGMTLAFAPHRRSRLFGLATIAVSGLLSRSLGFLIFATIVALLPELLPGRFRARYFLSIVGAGILAIPLLFFTSAGSTIIRLSGILSGASTDQSTNTRLTDPISILPSYLSEFPLGLPVSLVPDAAQSYYHGSGTLSFDNALLNFFFVNGFTAIAIIIVIVFSSKHFRVRLFLLSLMWFNGGYLRIDLVPIMITGIAYYNSGIFLYKRNLRLNLRDYDLEDQVMMTHTSVKNTIPYRDLAEKSR